MNRPSLVARRWLLPLLPAVTLVACGGGEPPPPAPPPCPVAPAAPVVGAPPASPAAPTVDDARAFLAQVNDDLRTLWVERDRAGWVSQTYITDDTEALAASGEEATAEYVTKKVHESHRFDALALPANLARQMKLLRLSQTVPAPSDPAKARALAQVDAAMTGAYGKGEYCPPARIEALALPQEGREVPSPRGALGRAVEEPRRPGARPRRGTAGTRRRAPQKREVRRRTWSSPTRAPRSSASTTSARCGARATTCRPPTSRRTSSASGHEVKPLYDELHCYVRAKLAPSTARTCVPEHGPIPAELLGNMWAQEWTNIYDLVEPYPGEPSLDVGKTLVAKKLRREGDGEDGRAASSRRSASTRCPRPSGSARCSRARATARSSATRARGT